VNNTNQNLKINETTLVSNGTHLPGLSDADFFNVQFPRDAAEWYINNRVLTNSNFINSHSENFGIRAKGTIFILESYTDIFWFCIPELLILFFILFYLAKDVLQEHYKESPKIFNRYINRKKRILNRFLIICITLFIFIAIATHGYLYEISLVWSNFYLGSVVFSYINSLTFEFFVTENYSLINHLLMISYHSILVKLILIFFFFTTIAASYDFLVRSIFLKTEFLLIVLLITLGLFILISSTDLFLTWLTIEFISLNLYLLAALNRSSIYSLEAGIKYLILGAVASSIMLFGISIIYGITSETTFWYLSIWLTSANSIPFELILGFLFLLIGFLFKLSVAPFHIWTADIYEGAPLPVTFIFSVPVKFGIFASFIHLYFNLVKVFSFQWGIIFLAVSVLSMIVGSLGGLQQVKLKRLFAFSSINNIGFVLLAFITTNHTKVSSGGSAGEAPYTFFYYSNAAIINAAYSYILIYFVSLTGVFAFLMMAQDKKKIGDSQITYITDLRGLGRNYPALAIMFSFCLLSLAGIPPMAGFFGKFTILWTLINSSFIYSWGVALVGIATSAISAFYYLRLIKIMFFDKSNYTPNLVFLTSAPVFILFFSFFFITSFFLIFKVFSLFVNFAFLLGNSSEIFVNSFEISTYELDLTLRKFIKCGFFIRELR
jgi:NADH-quinone oxidoreductase subunit N